MTPPTPARLGTKAYWHTFAGLVGVVLLLRFTVCLNQPAGERSILAMGFFFCSLALMGKLERVASGRLREHLMTHHWDKAVKICRVNSGPEIGWIFSDEDYGDSTLAALKMQCRRHFRWTVVALVGVLFVFSIVVE